MNISEFRATRRLVSDLSELTSFPEDRGVTAFVYADSVYIAIVNDSERGRYWLPIERSEVYSDNLAELEEQLHEYAVDAMGLVGESDSLVHEVRLVDCTVCEKCDSFLCDGGCE